MIPNWFVCFRRRIALAERANSNNPFLDFDMDANFQSGPKKVTLPGDKRRDCNAIKRNSGRIFKPMGLSIMSYFATIIYMAESSSYYP